MICVNPLKTVQSRYSTGKSLPKCILAQNGNRIRRERFEVPSHHNFRPSNEIYTKFFRLKINLKVLSGLSLNTEIFAFLYAYFNFDTRF